MRLINMAKTVMIIRNSTKETVGMISFDKLIENDESLRFYFNSLLICKIYKEKDISIKNIF